MATWPLFSGAKLAGVPSVLLRASRAMIASQEAGHGPASVVTSGAPMSVVVSLLQRLSALGLELPLDPLK